ncbi:acylphosphatase [Thermanaerovibrio velox]|nr:acylphosphatase [Thermanaerovibrio velox]
MFLCRVREVLLFMGSQGASSSIGRVVARRVMVSGHVQGVGFRRFVQMKAMGMGLRGFVRNVGLQSVEALLVGEPRAVEEMCQVIAHGHPWARVDRFECWDVPAEQAGPWEGFRVLPTVEEVD